MSLILHYHPLSSCSHKVLVALYEMGLPFEGRLLDLGDPQARQAHLARWPVGKMPVLEDGERVVPETSIIIEHLQQTHPGVAPLLPAEPAEALRVRLWDRLCDLYVMTPMQTLVGQKLRPEAGRDVATEDHARATLATAYGLLERQLDAGEWLCGPDFTLADCAAAPALFYARTIVPITPSQDRLAAYVERLLTRPSVARVLAEARPYLRHYPYHDALEARFL